MSTRVQHCTLEEFRKLHGGVKPHYEFRDGEAIQKAVPTKSHAKLQKLLANVLAERGMYSFTELTLRVDPNWEPIPDVAATIEDFEGPYPTSPVNVIAEVLSPEDTFSDVERKCERYATLGVADVLVWDPAERKVWRWDRGFQSLVRVAESALTLNSNGTVLDLQSVWARFDSER